MTTVITVRDGWRKRKGLVEGEDISDGQIETTRGVTCETGRRKKGEDNATVGGACFQRNAKWGKDKKVEIRRGEERAGSVKL